MPSLYRYKVLLGGWDGAPGLSVLYSTVPAVGIDEEATIQSFVNLIHDGYVVARGTLVGGVTVNVDPEVIRLDVETGLQQAFFSVNPPDTVTGTGSGKVSRATQATCRHITDAVTDRGRKLLGRTFVGPLAGSALGEDGRILTQSRAELTAMWDGMQDAVGARLCVWHRPKNGAGGSFGHVQASICLSKPGVLRSRRD